MSDKIDCRKCLLIFMYFLLIVLVVYVIMSYNQNYNESESMENLSNEAIQNIASIYNNENLTLNSLKVTKSGTIDTLVASNAVIGDIYDGKINLKKKPYLEWSEDSLSTSVKQKTSFTEDIGITKNIKLGSDGNGNPDTGIDIRDFIIPAYVFHGRNERNYTNGDNFENPNQENISKGGTPSILPLGQWKRFSGNINDNVNGIHVNSGFIVHLYRDHDLNNKIHKIYGPYHYKCRGDDYEKITSAICAKHNDSNGNPVWPKVGRIE